MDKILVNSRSVRKNKSWKANQKTCKKMYGRARNLVVKAKLGKLVMCKGTSKEQENNAFSNEKVMETNAFANGGSLTAEKLLELLKEKKLTGMSGNGFPVAKKIESFLEAKSARKILLINAVECEPGLVHDEWLLQNHREEIQAGARMVAEALGIEAITLASKLELPEQGKIRMCKVPARYPMGEEHILIQQVLGIPLEKSQIPVQHGILVMNVQTIYQIYQMVMGSDRPGHYVTLVNLENGEAYVEFAEGGANIKEMLKKWGAVTACYAGRGIMAAHPVNDTECFDGTISMVAVGSAVEASNQNSCKGCGKCVHVCPMKVNVREIVKRKEADPCADVSGLGLDRCLHCNTCSYYCSAHKNIAEYLE